MSGKPKALLVLLILAISAAVLTAVPSVVAQGLPPHRFFGTLSVDGQTASDGSVVSARIDGVEVATGTYDAARGSYIVDVEVQPGQTVTVAFFV